MGCKFNIYYDGNELERNTYQNNDSVIFVSWTYKLCFCNVELLILFLDITTLLFILIVDCVLIIF